MAAEAGMIYLPHTKFDFDRAQGGFIVGTGSPTGNVAHSEVLIQNSISSKAIIKKFSHCVCDSRRWKRCPSIALGFLREDGFEFAIRFISNPNIDVIAYWISPSPDIIVGRPAERIQYKEFLDWLENEVHSNYNIKKSQ